MRLSSWIILPESGKVASHFLRLCVAGCGGSDGSLDRSVLTTLAVFRPAGISERDLRCHCFFWPGSCGGSDTFGFLGGGFYPASMLYYISFSPKAKKWMMERGAFFLQGSWYYEFWLSAKNHCIIGKVCHFKFFAILFVGLLISQVWKRRDFRKLGEVRCHAGSRIGMSRFLLWENRERVMPTDAQNG